MAVLVSDPHLVEMFYDYCRIEIPICLRLYNVGSYKQGQATKSLFRI